VLIPIPRHATGFWHATDAVRPTRIDVKQFRDACHQAARDTGRQVKSVDESVEYENFHRAVLTSTHPDRSITVLCNHFVPLLAITEPAPRYMCLLFAEAPDLADAFAHTPFRLLTPAELNAPLTDAHLTALPRVERDQIRHWRPETVGQTLYNYWDYPSPTPQTQLY
jgi:hypothetical protein